MPVLHYISTVDDYIAKEKYRFNIEPKYLEASRATEQSSVGTPLSQTQVVVRQSLGISASADHKEALQPLKPDASTGVSQNGASLTPAADITEDRELSNKTISKGLSPGI